MDGRAISQRNDFRVDVTGPALPARGALYGAGESLCRTGSDGIIERLYHGPAMGVVHSTPFSYRTQTGAAMAVPGTILFGNAGEQFTCRQFDRAHNHRSVVAFDRALIEEAADAAGQSSAAFRLAALPPGPSSAPLHAAILRLVRSEREQEELVLALVAAAFGLDREAAAPPPSARDSRVVLDAVRFLEGHFAETHSLSDLAARAGLSRFHFLRLFRDLTGTSPNRFLIGLRLRACAERLQESAAPITEIALDAGFNDISHFNHLFRRAFAMSPGRWRRLGR
ncbi:helix-turn-helix domain-containing protein [Sphingosinicella sp.]|uniref:helix-turn-helix domain-containing protein n=1 Tax=Sphingosinicella sp. TaxID=1917971 RepID=UPI00403815F0